MSNDTQPEIRFPGFAEDWEQRKLGEVIDNQYNGQTPSRANASFWNGEINWLSSGELNRGVVSETIEKITEDGRKNANLKIVPKGTFVMAITGLEATGTRGNCAKLGIDTTMNQSCMALFPKKKLLDSSFLFQWYRKVGEEYGLQYTQGTKQQSYNAELLKILPIVLPSVSEQVLIADFFDKIDDTIALHQRKLDLLKETKKGFLQKMFPKNGAKVPEIRFPGFTGDWEQRKLGEVVERVTRKNKKLESIRPLTISSQEGLIDQNEFFNKTVASRDVSGYYLVKKGEFAYNKSYSNGYPWGAVKRLNQYDMGVLSTLYIVFKPKKIDSDFLEKYYDTTYWYKEVSKHAAEGARNHGLLNIAASDFFETEIVMPLKIEEQQKIGAFFKQLDDTIALHQRELDVLKETKKGFLQKMFV